METIGGKLPFFLLVDDFLSLLDGFFIIGGFYQRKGELGFLRFIHQVGLVHKRALSRGDARQELVLTKDYTIV